VSREGRFEFDRAYLDRLASGEPETDRHFTRYFGDLLSIKLRSRLRSPAQVEDARQETFLRVMKALRQPGGIQSPGGFGAFVNSVCNNVFLERLRAGRKAGLVSGNGDDGLDIESAPADVIDLDSQLVTDQARRRVREVLAGLNDRDKQLLRAIFFDETPKDDICRQFGVDREYLRVLLHRAKQHFRERYTGEAVTMKRFTPPAHHTADGQGHDPR